MLRTQIARSCAEIERIRSVWENLYANNPSATLFQSFEANRLAAEHFAGRESPFVVFAESDKGAALIPAAICRNGLTFLGEALFDYRDVLLTGDTDVLRAAWEKLTKLRLPLSVTALRGDSVSGRWAALFPASFVNAGQVLRNEISAAGFEQQHGRLRRTLRLLRREGFEVGEYSGTKAELVSWMYEQKAQQYEGPDSVFRDPWRREFMVEFCALKSLHCKLFVLKSSTAVAAALVTFRDRQVRRFYTIWFEPRWAQYSPGTALLFEITRRSLAEGLDCDYMTGEQPHKRRFQTSSVPLYRVNAEAELLETAACGCGSRESLLPTEPLLPTPAGPAGQEPGATSTEYATPSATPRSRSS